MSDFDNWLQNNGKTREASDTLDEILWLRGERQRLRLADAEREAVEWVVENLRLSVGVDRAATLRGLLARDATSTMRGSNA